MDTAYNPKAIETKIYQNWEENGYFKASDAEDSYCILIPPPNVTGSLHMGHAFQHTIMDSLIRYQRMQGKSTLWQAGTDHAGIATQMVVERLLNREGKTRQDLGREAFLEKVWDWKEHSGGTISQQMRRLGDSPDWSREAFTMSDELSDAVQEVFVRLYEEDLIYRGKRLVNWDPKFHTAISDLEVENKEEKGSLWHFRYPLAHDEMTADGKKYIVVATTRPETMLGDTAVAVHPEDERYQDLIGKSVILPLVNREIPIVADEYVDKEFGTGCVKITPAHDFNDYEVGKRHQTPLVNILDQNAAILNEAEAFTFDGKVIDDFDGHLPEGYCGLDRFDARKKIIIDFDGLGLLDSIKEHTLQTPRGDRSGAVIEPYLTDQWYVRVGPLAKPAIEAVENGSIKFVPENWSKTYYNWMNNLEDWCISRQLWWGHRIPAWYDESGKVYVGRTEDEVREKYQLDPKTQLSQDDDVLDTWFSSALWPFATLGWPQKTPELDKFLPTDVLVTGFDIIFFWVARMIMMTLKFTDQVPFKEIYITGLIRDEHGDKMSKSKGNVLDPIDIIDGIDIDSLVEKRTSGMMQPKLAEKVSKRTRKQFSEGIASYGTDAMRFTFCSLASTSRDISFDLNRVEGYRNFCNKLWNASRFVVMNTEQHKPTLAASACEYSLADRWIQALLQKVTAEYHRHIKNYRFDLAATELYEFTWNEYCSWYLELTKPVLNDENVSDAAKQGTRRTLLSVLESLLKLLHPMMPFITEEIWQKIAPLADVSGDTIMLQPFPQVDETQLDDNAIEDIEWLKLIIVGVRKIRDDMGISPGKPLTIYLRNGDREDQIKLDQNRNFLMKLAKLEQIHWLTAIDEAPLSATALAGHLEVLIPMAGLIDKDAELARLSKELDKLQKEVARFEGKLNNANFTEKAPAAVVEKEKQKLIAAKDARAKIESQLEQIKTL